MSERKLEIVHPEIERYMGSLAESAQPVCDTVLEMEELARERDFPIVGRLAGRFLFQQALLLGAKRIFEMGSGFGYSAYWFARAAGGDVICTDTSPENAELAGGFMKKAGFEKKVRFFTGDAIDILTNTGGEFDIVFCDIDKEAYPSAFAAARGKIRKGGLFLADNAFWDGKAALPDGSPAAQGIIKFNKTAVSDPDFLTVQVPLRDGISVSLKLV
ncbi:MAG: methyltransferase domain-containing protein [Candidatus Mycalebacterium zealandia]|nr:MAG: methyltransferase domain-containing protein [Candidatus Mycalebacterium zealandia]